MLKRILLAAAATFALAGAALAGSAPAAFVLGMELSGSDAQVIKRDNTRLAPKLMMPLYSGDVIEFNDPASKLSLEIDGGTAREVTAAESPFAISGEVETGDDTWSVISAIAGVIGGEEGASVPDNMVSKTPGLDMKILLAEHGANFVVAGQPLWLAWSGGTAPFSIDVEPEGAPPITLKSDAAEISLTPPEGADRFTVTVYDTQGLSASAVFRPKAALPQPADAMPPGTAGALISAAWLTGQSDGAWTIAAAQGLHGLDDPQAKALLTRIMSGWRLGG